MKRIKEDYPIDLVIAWVDGADSEWKKERDKYVTSAQRHDKNTGGDERYIDDGLLQYLFRGIEKYMPWINKVHFLTWGHLPSWLDTSNTKINIVKHEDFIPKKYLPTFNANPIVLNLHRIPGLSEHFIFMNDDMYPIAPLKRTDFFRKKLPCDMAVQEPIALYKYDDAFTHILINNISLLNMATNKYVSQKQLRKWINLKYGFKNIIRNLLLYPFVLFTGLYEPHTPCSYVKSTYSLLWKRFSDVFDEVCQHKVRSKNDCSEYLIRYYQLVNGDFVPFNRDRIGVYRSMGSKDLPDIILGQKKKMICINYYDKGSFDTVKKSFEKLLPNKSKFEI